MTRQTVARIDLAQREVGRAPHDQPVRFHRQDLGGVADLKVARALVKGQHQPGPIAGQVSLLRLGPV